MPFIFEGDLDLGAIGLDLAVRDHQVLLDHLGHAQIPQVRCRALDRGLGSLPQDFGSCRSAR
jgi:hypothetical protein